MELREYIACHFWMNHYRNWSAFTMDVDWKDASEAYKVECYQYADRIFDEIIIRLKKRWNEESVETRNQESQTLPRWVRRALGQDAQDMRKFNTKQVHIRREKRNG